MKQPPYFEKSQRLRAFVQATWCAGIIMSAALSTSSILAQEDILQQESYIKPPSPILEQVTAPWESNFTLQNLSPSESQFLVGVGDGMVSMDRLAAPYVILGETALDPTAMRSRRMTTRSEAGYRLHQAKDGTALEVTLPEGARASNASWSPDGSRFAFLAHFADASYLYMADCETGETRQVCEQPLLATMVTSFDWSLDGTSIAAVFVPEGIEKPAAAPVDTTPTVRVARNGNKPSRTYRFLLNTPADQQMLEYLTTGQLAVIDVESGEPSYVGEPRMYLSFDMSPNADAFRVSTMLKPFTYYEPTSRFGRREELIDREGNILTQLSERLIDGEQDDDDESEEEEPPKRSLTWRPDGAGLSFLQKEPKPKEEPAADDSKDDDAPSNDAKGDDAKRDGDQGGGDQGGNAKGDAAKGDPDMGGDAKGDDTKKGDPQDDSPKKDQKPGDGTQPDDQDKDGDKGDDDKDEEEKKEEPKLKDRVMLWKFPFGDDDVEVVYESEEDIQAVQYSKDVQTLFVTKTVDERRTIFAFPVDKQDGPTIIYRGERGRGGQGPGGRGGARGGRGPTPAPARGGNRGGARGGRRGGPPNADDDGDRPGRGRRGDGDEPEKPRGATRGSLMTDRTAAGDAFVRMSADGFVYFSGTDQADDENEDDQPDDDQADEGEDELSLPVPYVDSVEIASGEVKNLYEGDGEMLEGLSTFVAPSGEEPGFVVITKQMSEVVPDSYVIPLDTKEPKKLTDNKNYAPWYGKLEKIRFQVERVDGFKFWVTAYRSRDYGMKLPAMFWFYPREVNDQESYDRTAQRSGSPQAQARFQRPSTRSMTHLTQIGYVVVEPDCPIVGEQGEWNDNYLPDLRNNLWAVIDALDKKDWIDRDRLAIGGHSYGAFGTANALAHTPFFKAGIAGDGNYNRTLTPMSFQREPRYLWDAREVYTQMSPLFWVDQIEGALLMYHGIDDANVGTWPINSERMFQALDGVGKPASLYMYPYEAHGPIGEDSILDMWARWIEWLDVYVKHPERGKELAKENEDDD